MNRARRPWSDGYDVVDATRNNLRNVSVTIPAGMLTCITGVAGSGKSSLVQEFVDTLDRSGGTRIVVIDQRPVGRSSRSNPATYIGIFDAVRKAFAAANDVKPGLFSFNSDGSCPECKGSGFIEFELSFIDDVRLDCSTCEGRRYRDDILELTYHGQSIHDVLDMTVTDAIEFFTAAADCEAKRADRIVDGLHLLADVGVGYLRLGQSLSTLSGGEAQRLKLASELSKTGSIYLMDEPTTGLHPADIDRLLAVIDRMIEAGNTVVVVEHNLDVVAAADWIIDVGPEGGQRGGRIVATGTPEEIANDPQAGHTGRYLRRWLAGQRS